MLDGWESLQEEELAELKRELEVDGLQHAVAARTLLLNVSDMSPGAVVAVQGPWGRGKTNVLKRLAVYATESAGAGDHSPKFVSVIVLNPWQYGDPDLLSPLILKLLEVLKESLEGKRDAGLGREVLGRIKLYLPRILSAAVNVAVKAGLKVVDRVFLWGDVVSLASDEVQQLLRWLFPGETDKSLRENPVLGDGERVVVPQQDPVSGLGESFRRLVELILEAKGFPDSEDHRILVCVDDLDRCLPHRQVALLEAIGFLTCRKAAVNFVISLDPLLASQAIRVHYGSDLFDVERYLDKLFDLRISLPSLSKDDATQLVGVLVRLHAGDRRLGDVIARMLTAGSGEPTGQEERTIEQAFLRALLMPTLRNPRVIRRVIERLHLLANRLKGRGSVPGSDLGLLVLWLCMCECWPELRRMLQQGGETFDEGLFTLWQRCGEGAKRASEDVAANPILMRFPTGQPEFRHVIYHLSEFGEQGNDEQRIRGVAERLRVLDGQLVKAGL